MTKVSEAFHRVLRHHGVKAVFGNPGSNELSFLTGLPDDLPHHLALQEGAAVTDPLVKWSGEARDPVLLLGPGAGTDEGFEAAVALAEKACLPVWIAPSAFTDDPGEAARAPMGRFLPATRPTRWCGCSTRARGATGRSRRAACSPTPSRSRPRPSSTPSTTRHQVPVTFMICANRRHRALEEFADPLAVARGYGLETHHGETLKDLTEFVHEGVHAERPRLVLVDQR